jgi:hypothetical protein
MKNPKESEVIEVIEVIGVIGVIEVIGDEEVLGEDVDVMDSKVQLVFKVLVALLEQVVRLD